MDNGRFAAGLAMPSPIPFEQQWQARLGPSRISCAEPCSMAGRETETGGEVAGGRARRDGAGDPGGARRGDGRAGEERVECAGGARQRGAAVGWRRQHMGRWRTRFRLHGWRGRRNQSLAGSLAAHGSHCSVGHCGRPSSVLAVVASFSWRLLEYCSFRMVLPAY